MVIDPGLAMVLRELFRNDRYSCLMMLVFSISAIPLSIMDIRERRIPDRILLPVAVVLIALDALSGGIDIAALAAAATTALVMAGAGRLSGAGMGMGDVKMGAVGAFVLGPVGGWIMLTTGAVLGVAYGTARAHGRGNRSDIPFAPFLTIGAACAIVIRSVAFRELA